jgi:hypothetical protein
MHYRMPVGEGIDVPVNDYTLANALGILQIVTSLYIITDVVPNDNVIRVAREIYVGKDIHP